MRWYQDVLDIDKLIYVQSTDISKSIHPLFARARELLAEN